MNYKLPKLRDQGGDLSKRWAVYWYILNEKNEWIRHVEWISTKTQDRKARYLEAEKIIKEVTTQLKEEKFNIEIKSKEKLVTVLQNALEWKKKYVSRRTFQTYDNITQKLIKWINKNMPGITYDKFNSHDANRFIEHIFGQKDYEAKTINCNIGYLHTIYKRIGELYPIGKNPFQIAKLIENEPETSIWNEDLKIKIANHLKENKPELFTILLMVYHCYLRPDEIRQIQVKNINLERGTIKIIAKKGKSNHVKYPTISNQLREILTPLIKSLNPEDYIFSRGLKPGKKPISRNVISMSFKKFREELKIPKEYKLYHFKHTGNSEMLEKGLNIRELQAQNGHSSISITEKYLRKINDFANSKIVNLSSEL